MNYYWCYLSLVSIKKHLTRIFETHEPQIHMYFPDTHSLILESLHSSLSHAAIYVRTQLESHSEMDSRGVRFRGRGVMEANSEFESYEFL